MAGTREGGRKAAATNKLKYGSGFYSKIGARGGHNGHTGGFAANHKLARIAGGMGGRKSVRGAALSKIISSEYKCKPTLDMFNKVMGIVIKLDHKLVAPEGPIATVTSEATSGLQCQNNLAVYLNSKPRLKDERVKLITAVLYKLREKSLNEANGTAITEVKALLVSLSGRSAIAWTQGKTWYSGEWKDAIDHEVSQ